MIICFVLGTRPEIIKLFPLIKICKKKKIKHFVIHTGQHNSYLMEKKFFLILPEIVSIKKDILRNQKKG